MNLHCHQQFVRASFPHIFASIYYFYILIKSHSD
jgi:hypothetical protein